MNTNIEYMATHSVEDIKEYLNINLSGLTEEEVLKSRDKNINCGKIGGSIYKSVYGGACLSGCSFYHNRYYISDATYVRKYKKGL